MSITVEVISKETIKPSTPTPYQLKNHSLSLIDQYIIPCFIPLIFFYPVAPKNTGNKQHGDNVSLLKRSLSETLVHFYPLAGRVKDNIVVDCNDDGIEFIEAKVSGSMCDFLEKPDEQLSGLLPSEVVCMNYVRDIQVFVQVNTFDCRSIAISLFVSHKVADVATITAFIRCWAQITIAVSRTTSITSPINVSSKLHPTFDAASLYPPIKQLVSPSMATVTELDSNPSEESKSDSKIISKKFVFEAKMITSVREKLSASMADKYKFRRPSRVEVVSALIWKSFVKLASPGSSSVMVRHAVNLRRRIEPPLPDVSFGNILEFSKLVVGGASTEKTTLTTHGSRSCKLHDDLNEFVFQLRESIDKLSKGDHDFDMENAENEGRHLWMSSWGNYGLYDIDFGWGKPILVTTVGSMFAYPDAFYMNDTRCGEGIEVWGNLVEEDMYNFQHNLSELLDRI
ncbi:hypothetical protein MKX01_023236 [Papaver californicum]|nr:hypothetical protein MKX01_023236 [Papaver californicum]